MNELAHQNANEEQLISNEDKTKKVIENDNKEESIDTSLSKTEDSKEGKVEKGTCKNTIAKILYHFKDYLFLLALLVSPIPNYSYLTLFYVVIAILNCLFLLSKSDKIKNAKLALEIIVLAYATIVLIIKIVFISMRNKPFITNNRDFLIDLGMTFLKNENNSHYPLFEFEAFFADCIIIALSILCMLISIFCRKFTEKDDRTKKTHLRNTSIMIWLVYLSVIGLCCFNISFSTLIMIIAAQISLFVWVIKEDRSTIVVMKFCQAVILLFSITLLILINVFNILSLREKYFPFIDGQGDFEKTLKAFGVIGVNPRTKEEVNFKEGILHFITYCTISLTIILCSTTFKIVSSRFVINEPAISPDLVEQPIKEEKKENKCIKFLKTIYEYLQSPYFILHFCRIGVIFWLYVYRNYPSVGLLIWLFFSFLVLNIKKMKYLTFIVKWPCLLYTIWTIHISNIKGILLQDAIEDNEKRIKYEHIGLRKWEKYNEQYIIYPFNQYFEYAFMNIVFIFAALFSKALLNYKDSDEKKKPKIENIDPLLKEIIIDDGKKEEKKKKEVSLGNIVLKLIIVNIDKITLVVMYVLSIYTVNISHLILVIIFMIQLLRPSAIEKICYFVLVLIQLIFSAEYILDIVKVFLGDKLKEETFINIVKFVCDFDGSITKTSVEIVLLAAIYCFYIQYQNYNSELYVELIKSKDNTMTNYTEIQFKNYPKIKAILNFIGTVFLELYVWLLIILCFLFICQYEVNILFGIKFLLFLIVCYEFLSSVQKSGTITFSLILNWIFLIYCCANTLIVYFYQFTRLPIDKDFFDNVFNTLIPKEIKDNFPIIGIIDYDDSQFASKFLPHFAMNFLSVLFYWETNRIITKESQMQKQNNQKLFIEEENKEEDLINNENLKPDAKKIKIEEKYNKNKIEIRKLKAKSYIYSIIVLLSKFYWLLLFNAVCVIFTTYDLTLSMIIYILIFGLIFIFMFRRLINSLSNFISKPSFFLSKLIRKNLVEEPSHIEKSKHYRKIGFRFLLIFSMFYIFATYLYAIFDIIKHGCSDCGIVKHPLFKTNTEEYIQSIGYIVGVYINIRKNSIFKGIWVHILLILLISCDVYVQKIQNYCTEKTVEKNKLIQKYETENSIFKAKFLQDMNIFDQIGAGIANIDRETVIVHTSQIRSSSNTTNSQMRDSQNPTISKIINNEHIGTSQVISNDNQSTSQIISTDSPSKSQVENTENEKPQENKENTKTSRLIDERSPSFSEVIDIQEDVNDKKLLDTFYLIFRRVGQSHNKRYIKTTNNRYKFIQASRKVIEEVIVTFLMVIAIAKLNVWSYIYFIIVIYLYMTKKTMKKFYYLLIFLIFSTIIQALFFLSNLTEDTDPDPDIEILNIVSKRLHIPWYKDAIHSDAWGFFLGLGVGKTLQVNLIYMDFLLISFLYIYLDYFSYAIYQDDDENIKDEVNQVMNNSRIGSGEFVVHDNLQKKTKRKNKFYNLTGKTKLIEAINNLEPKEYTKHKNNLKYTFDMELDDSFEEFKKIFIPNSDKNEKEEEKKEEQKIEPKPTLMSTLLAKRGSVAKPKIISLQKKKKKFKCLKAVKKIFYLYLHNFVLTFIILISMMVSGLISSIYITFSLIFLMKSSSLILGKKCDYPKAIKTFMRILILIDIIIQLIAQIPALNFSENTIVNHILKSIGISTIIQFGGENKKVEDFKVKHEEMVLVYAKAFTFFIMSIQVVVYNSDSFQNFYLYYIFTKKDISRKMSLLNVFWFNNNRIEQMNKKLENRREMKKAMDSLEKTLEEWDQKLFIMSQDKSQIMDKARKSMMRKSMPVKEDIQEEEKEEELPKNNEENKEENEQLMQVIQEEEKEEFIPENKVKEKLRKYILERFLVKILIFIHKSSPNYNSVEKNDRDEFIKDIIQGKTELLTLIEKQVDYELNSLDLSNLTKKDIKEIKGIIDNANKLQKEEEEKAEKEQKALIEAKKRKKEREEKAKENKIILEEEDEDEPIESKDKEVNPFKDQPKEEKKKSKKELELEKEKEEREKYLNSPKILQFKRLVTKKLLFKKYLKTSYILRLITEDIIYFISNNSHFLCYLMMIINHMVSGSLLSVVYPLSIFCYGLFEYPRPNRTFWDFCIKYTIGVIIVKFVIQLHFLSLITGYTDTLLEFLTKWKFGLEYFEQTFTTKFFNYIVCDAILLFVLLIHSYVMISLGIWKKTERDIENVQQAYERIFKTKDLEIYDVKAFNSEYIKNKSHESLAGTGINTMKSEDSICSEINPKVQLQRKQKIKALKTLQKDKFNYFELMFPRVRNQKPGSNYYPVFTIIIMLIIVYIIFFYTSMDQDKTYGSTTTNTRQFSGVMVLFVFVHVIFAVIDRVIYLRQNRTDLEFEYVFYEKKTGEKLPVEEFDKIKEDILSEYPRMKKNGKFEIPLPELDRLKETYNIVTIQKEPPNYPLIMKYVLTIVIAVFSHFFIFFFLPLYGNYNLNNTVSCFPDSCNDFVSNIYLIFFYIIYILYLFFSGLQIKNGYMDMIQKSILKTGETTIHSGIYSGFKAIPFLYEIKLAIDWTFTRTSLDIFQWNKFESVYDTIYLTLCAMKYVNKRPVGTQITKIQKTFMGGSLFVGLLLIILVPLLIFSNLNPSNEFNNITGASISLYISFKEGNAIKNYTLFTNDYVEGITNLTDDTSDLWKEYNYTNAPSTKNFPKAQIQIVKMSRTSDTNWNLATPHIQNMITLLDKYNSTKEVDLINFGFTYQFIRPKPTDTKNSVQTVYKEIYNKNRPKEAKTDIIENLKKAINGSEYNEIIYDKFYYPSVRLTSEANPKLIRDSIIDETNNLAINITFHCEKDGDKVDYAKSYFELTKIKNGTNSNIEFHTFSDKVSSYVSEYSVLTFYVTVILLLGNYIRNFFTGQPEKIMLTEMPEPEKLINLCEGIKQSRYSFELEKEEQLYYVLIEFMRSPDYLKMLTKSSLRQFKERKKYLKKEDDDF